MKSCYFFFVFSLFFAPLAFGTVELWSLTVLECTILASLFCLLYFRLVKRGQTIYLPPGLIPLSLFVFFLLFQVLPLPISIVKILSPASYDLKVGTIGLVDKLSWSTISINPSATLAEFYRFFSYFCIYFVTTQLLTRKKYLISTVKLVVALGSVLAILAILQMYTAERLIYWFRTVPGNAILPMGPYIYHNHYAGFMGMVSPLAIGLFLAVKPNIEIGSNLRKRFIDFFDQPQHSNYLFVGAGAVLMVVSIFLSLSRGGMISICGALICYSTLLISYKRLSVNKASFCIITVFIFLLIGWFGWDVIVERFFKIYSFDEGILDGRIDVWSDTLKIIRDFWLTGTGFGTYINIFPGYRTFAGGNIFDHAHNDYLELLSSSGLIGLILVASFVFVVARKFFKSMEKSSDSYPIFVGCGCLSGIIAILFHSVTDFNFYNGANGFYFFFLCGLLVSVSHTDLSSSRKRSSLEVIKAPKSLWLSFGLLIIVFATAVNSNFGAMKAKNIYDRLKNIELAEVPPGDFGTLNNSARLMINSNGMESRYNFMAGNILMFEGAIDASFDYFKKAVTLNPSNSEYVQRLGIVADTLNIATGNKLLQKGIDLAPRSSVSYLQYARWLMFNSRTDESFKVVRSAIVEEPGSIIEALKLMESAGFFVSMMQKAIPDNIGAQLYFCRYLLDNNKFDEAGVGYDRAMKILMENDNNDLLETRYYTQVANYYNKNQQYEKAIPLLKYGVKKYPQDNRILLSLGNSYRKSEDSVNAKRAYLKSISLSPKSTESYIGLGATLNDTGDFTGAKDAYDSAYKFLKKNRNDKIWHYYSIINFFEKNKNYQYAFDVAQVGIQSFPRSVQMQVKFGRICQKMGKRIRAGNAFERAWELLSKAGENNDVWLFRSVASYYYKKDDVKAAEILQTAIELYPDDSSSFINIGVVYSRLGKRDSAKKALEKALQLSPENERVKELLHKLR